MTGHERPNGCSLKKEEWGAFLEKGFQTQGHGRVLTLEHKQNFLNHLFMEKDQQILRSLWGLVFENISEEVGRLKPSQAGDSRFLSCLCLAGEASPQKARHSNVGRKKALSKRLKT